MGLADFLGYNFKHMRQEREREKPSEIVSTRPSQFKVFPGYCLNVFGRTASRMLACISLENQLSKSVTLPSVIATIRQPGNAELRRSGLPRIHGRNTGY